MRNIVISVFISLISLRLSLTPCSSFSLQLQLVCARPTTISHSIFFYLSATSSFFLSLVPMRCRTRSSPRIINLSKYLGFLIQSATTVFHWLFARATAPYSVDCATETHLPRSLVHSYIYTCVYFLMVERKLVICYLFPAETSSDSGDILILL